MTSLTPKARRRREGDLKQRAAGNGDQRLGAVVGERAQARAEARGENHRLHLATFSSSILLKFDVAHD